MRLCFVVFFSIFFAPFIQAKDTVKTYHKDFEDKRAQVTLTISPNHITMAQSLQLTVEILVPKGFRTEMPKFKHYRFSTDFQENALRFRPTDITPEQKTIDKDGNISMRQSFTLEPWLSGNYAIPPIMIGFFRDKPKEEKAQEDKAFVPELPVFYIITDGIRIAVAPLENNNKELVQIYPPVNYKVESIENKIRRKEDKSAAELKQEKEEQKKAQKMLQGRKFPWRILWTILALITAFLSVKWLKKFYRRIFPQKIIPAHEKVFRALELLMQKNWIDLGRIKEYYFQLSYILREYIEERFAVYALHQTTEEFLQALLEHNPFEQNAENILKEFSELADQVKFARFVPQSEIAKKSFGIVKDFIDTTKQEEDNLEAKQC